MEIPEGESPLSSFGFCTFLRVWLPEFRLIEPGFLTLWGALPLRAVLGARFSLVGAPDLHVVGPASDVGRTQLTRGVSLVITGRYNT